ncbi:MAG: acyl-CoA thioesterase [Rhodocyclaceae bacterium]|nr:acyl-CoA thioesterase [Rhodocyclaceae bacterium]MBX3670699.1 acyl-CoA thioesterase [Rhodocyclaceae bacterium]
MRLRHRLRVRWSEVDAQRIVFNGNYLSYFDVGITEYWRAIGLPYPEALSDAENDLFAVRSTVNYHAPAFFDDWLDICLRAARLGNSSMRFEFLILRGAERIASGEVVYVNAHPVERRARPLPERLRAAILRFEGREEIGALAGSVLTAD